MCKLMPLREMPVVCIDPGDGAIYHRRIEIREPLRLAPKPTGGSKKKTSKKK